MSSDRQPGPVSLVAPQEVKLTTAAKDALNHAVAKADAKKKPAGLATRIVREVLRGILPW